MKMIKKFEKLSKEEFNILANRQYVSINSEVLRNNIKTINKNSKLVPMYLWLTTNIAGEDWNDTTGFPLKKKFYEKGKLACTFSIRTLVETFGSSKRTIYRNINKMEELGWLVIAKIKGNSNWREQNVYVLGEHTWVVVDGEKIYMEYLYFNELGGK